MARHAVPPDQLTLHADRGSPMKAKATALMLADLGVVESHSRPHTSNDNPFSEAHFKTLKYQPEFPKRFETIDGARTFCRRFFAWYDENHHHGRPSSRRHRADDTRSDPLWAGLHHPCRPPKRSRCSVPKHAGAVRSQAPKTTTNPESCLDQPTKANGANPSLNSQPRCLKVVDTFRLAPRLRPPLVQRRLGDPFLLRHLPNGHVAWRQHPLQHRRFAFR